MPAPSVEWDLVRDQHVMHTEEGAIIATVRLDNCGIAMSSYYSGPEHPFINIQMAKQAMERRFNTDWEANEQEKIALAEKARKRSAKKPTGEK